MNQFFIKNLKYFGLLAVLILIQLIIDVHDKFIEKNNKVSALHQKLEYNLTAIVIAIFCNDVF